jgi:thioredoxin reductase (NADPH)
MEQTDTRNLIIIGSGPAGLTAALYAARGGLNPLLFAGYQPGGQLTTTTVIENYPGFPEGIDGSELMANFTTQAKRFGTEILNTEVASVDFSGDVKIVTDVEGKQYRAKSVIIATGAKPRTLNIPGEQEYWGRGVSTCATCDGFLFRGKEIAVIGGGDTAMEEALFLTNHASKVYVVHRREQFRASKIMADRLLANPKVEVIWNATVSEVVGENGVVNKLKLQAANDQPLTQPELNIQGMFLAIGHNPVTKFLGGALKLNAEEYVDSPDGVNTSIPGVFVAGDVQDYRYRQAVTAAGMGCAAALTAQRYLETQ